MSLTFDWPDGQTFVSSDWFDCSDGLTFTFDRLTDPTDPNLPRCCLCHWGYHSQFPGHVCEGLNEPTYHPWPFLPQLCVPHHPCRGTPVSLCPVATSNEVDEHLALRPLTLSWPHNGLQYPSKGEDYGFNPWSKPPKTGPRLFSSTQNGDLDPEMMSLVLHQDAACSNPDHVLVRSGIGSKGSPHQYLQIKRSKVANWHMPQSHELWSSSPRVKHLQPTVFFSADLRDWINIPHHLPRHGDRGVMKSHLGARWPKCLSSSPGLATRPLALSE